MLWTHEAQPSESTTNFDHCDDANLLSIRVQTMLNHIRFVFYHNIKTKERNLCQDLLTVENNDSSDFPFKNSCKLTQHAETIRKNVWEKSNNTYSLLRRVQTRLNHILICFYHNINVKEKFFQSTSWKRHCVTHWCEQRGMDSYRQRQISQSDRKFSSNGGKINKSNVV